MRITRGWIPLLVGAAVVTLAAGAPRAGAQDGNQRPGAIKKFKPGPKVRLGGVGIQAKATAPDGFEADNTGPTARTVTLPLTNELHTIFPAGDIDVVRFVVPDLPAGATQGLITVETAAAPNDDLIPSPDTVVELHNSTFAGLPSPGTLIADNDDGGDGLFSRLTIRVGPGNQAPGTTLFLVVRAFGTPPTPPFEGSTNLFNYTLSISGIVPEATQDVDEVESNDEPDLADPIGDPLPRVLRATLSPQGDVDFFSFELQRATPLVIETRVPDVTVDDTQLALFRLLRNGDLRLIAFNDDRLPGRDLSSRLRPRLPRGIYFVRVDGFRGSTVDRYSLVVRRGTR
jgi:hypothetical protein